MFYVFKVNGALLQLNVDPNNILGEFRRRAQQLGKKLGYTPQETALMIVNEIPHTDTYRINKINLTGWINTGKVRLEIPDIGHAAQRVMTEFAEDNRY